MQCKDNQIVLVDCNDTKQIFNLKDKGIIFIRIAIVSGDEVAEIHYKDNSCDIFDSGLGSRFTNLYEETYTIIVQQELNKWNEYLCNHPNRLDYIDNVNLGFLN